MELKSRMTLDISGVTRNLQKVNTQAQNLAGSLATQVGGALSNAKAVSEALKIDAKQYGGLNVMRAQIDTFVDSVKLNMTIAKKSFDDFARSLNMSTAARSLSGIGARVSTMLGDPLTKAAAAAVAFKNKASAAFSAVSQAAQNFRKSSLIPVAKQIQKMSDSLNKFIKNLSGKLNIGNRSLKDMDENARKVGRSFKDVSRIVQGIVVAQVFYRALNAIQATVRAVWDFSQALEYSRLVYTTFFGNVSLADNFTKVLQDFAAQTRFGFNELNKAAQQLVAYGFQAKNLMYVLRGVSAAASVTGDEQSIESISRALGQIYTKGRLVTQELNQLAEAGIPAFAILEEKLGLTKEQLANIGDAGIPASAAINALIDGMNDRFGNLLDASNKTISGMISNVGDLGLQIGKVFATPVVLRFRWILSGVLSTMQSILTILNTQGVGGLFEHIVPAGVQDTIRNIIVSLRSLWGTIQLIAGSLRNILSSIGPTLLTWLNALITSIASLARVASQVLYAITSNAKSLKVLTGALIVAATAWTIYKISAIRAAASAAIIKGLKVIRKGLASIANMLTILASHPLLALLVVLTGAFLVATGAFDKARDSVNNFFSSLNNHKKETVLQKKEVEESSGALDDYSHALDGTSDSLKKVTKEAKKTKQALSFDEIFTIAEPNGDAGNSIESQWADLLNNIDAGKVDLDGVFEDFDFNDFGGAFIESLAEGFKKNLMNLGKLIKEKVNTKDLSDVIRGAAFGAISLAITGISPVGIFTALGAALAGVFWSDIIAAFKPENSSDVNIKDVLRGAIFAGVTLALVGFSPTGVFASVGAALVGIFWDDLIAAFGLDFDIDLKSVIEAAVVGLTTGKTFGFKAGLFATVATLLVSGFEKDIDKAFGDNTTQEMLGNIMSAGVVGALTKMQTNSLLKAELAIAGTYIVQKLIEAIGDYFNKDKSVISDAIGKSIVGAIVGGLGAALGGLPVLAVAPIAALVAGIMELFRDEIEDFLLSDKVADLIGGLTFTGIATALGTALGGPLGGAAALAASAFISAFWDEIASIFTKPFDELGDRMKQNWTRVASFFKFTGEESWQDIGANIVQGIFDGIGTAIETVFDVIYTILFGPLEQAIKDVFGIHSPATTMMPIGKYIVEGIFEGISGTIGWLVDNIKGFAGDVFDSFKSWTSDVKTNVETWFTDTKSGIATWVTDTKASFGTWTDDTRTKFSTWSTDVKASIGNWTEDTKTSIGSWIDNTKTKIQTWRTNVKTKFDTLKDNIKTAVDTWTADTKASIFSWTSDSFGEIDRFTTGSLASIGQWALDVAAKVKSALSSAWSAAQDLVSNAKSGIGTIWDRVTGAADREKSEDILPRFIGHANGGVFDREHIARFAEGNKREAIIPLENYSAMKPFSDAVSADVIQTLAPILANVGSSGSDNRPILMVGTLVADERGLKELNRKMRLIDASEDQRKLV